MKRNYYKKMVIAIMISYFIIAVIGLLLVFPYAQESIVSYLVRNKESVLIIAGSFIFIIIIVPIYLFLFYFNKKENEYNTENQSVANLLKYKSLISDERESIERQLYELNKRLSASADHWEETNNLILESQNKLNKNLNGVISPEKFLENYGIIPGMVKIDYKEVFVLTPFNDDFLEAYEAIKSACNKVKLTAVRSDEEYIESNIMEHIVKNIVSARIVVANVNGRNANVMYELGIAHALNKTTIIIDQGNQLVPFDIQGKYVIIYKTLQELEDKLIFQLLSIMSTGK